MEVILQKMYSSMMSDATRSGPSAGQVPGPRPKARAVKDGCGKEWLRKWTLRFSRLSARTGQGGLMSLEPDAPRSGMLRQFLAGLPGQIGPRELD